MMRDARARLLPVIATTLLAACPDPTFTVGGTVSGLRGTLILQNNGADDLSVTEDGAFTFATPLVNGSLFTISAASTPADQNCAISNATGKVSGAAFTDAVVSCSDKNWHYPADFLDHLSLGGWDANEDFRVAMNGSGDAIVTWSQIVGTRSRIYKSEYRAGTWTLPTVATSYISAPGDVDAYTPDVALDDNGDAVIVWVQDTGGTTQIFMAEYRGGAWSARPTLADHISPAGQGVSTPRVAMDGQGNTIVVWSQNFGIYKSEYRNGGWVHPADLTDSIAASGSNPAVAMDAEGNAIVVWAGTGGIYKSEYWGGAWTHPTSTADAIGPVQSCRSPLVGMSDGGDAVIVWEGNDGSFWHVYKSELHAQVWTHPADPNDRISPTGGLYGTDGASLAMDGSGNAVVAWRQHDGTTAQIFKSDYRNGTWSHPSSINDRISFVGVESELTDVAIGEHGEAVVVWEQRVSSAWKAFKAEYRRGSWMLPSSTADYVSLPGTDVGYTRVAIAGNGDAMIVWDQPDGAYLQIYASELR